MTAPTVAVERRVLADTVSTATLNPLVRDAVLVCAGVLLTAGAAQISIPIEPLSPVPLTGQTLAVLLVGAALGPIRAIASMAIYLVAGALGTPWFAGGTSGTGLVSFGYVIGFVLAGAVVGELARRGGDRTPLRTAGTMALGNLVIYAVGAPYLAVAAHLSLESALTKGVVPYLLGDAIKLVIAAALLPITWSLIPRSADAADAP